MVKNNGFFYKDYPTEAIVGNEKYNHVFNQEMTFNRFKLEAMTKHDPFPLKGPHEGKPLKDMFPEQLLYCYDNFKLPPDLKLYIEENYDVVIKKTDWK